VGRAPLLADRAIRTTTRLMARREDLPDLRVVLGTLRFGPLPALLPVLRDFVLAWVSTPSSVVGITAQTHLVALMSLPVLPVIPIVEAKSALPWFGHAQIVLPAQWSGK
jgi:hypothetical protein